MAYHRCGKCDYKTNRKFNLKIHIERKHANEIEKVTPAVTPVAITSKALQCDTCLRIFSSRAAKSRHRKNVKCKPPPETLCQPVEPVEPVEPVLTPTQYPVMKHSECECSYWQKDSLTAEQVLIRKLKDEIEQLKNENDRLRRRMQGFKDTDKKKIAAEQGWKCNICCIELPFNYQIDHIIPISAGGLNDMSNGQALCVECHERKSCWEKK